MRQQTLRYFLLILCTCPSVSAHAGPWAATNNSLFTEEQTPNPFAQKFQAGQSEIDIHAGLNYSKGEGSITDIDFAYRFAPGRRFLVGMGGSFANSAWTDSFSLGPEARLYFAEFRRWSISATQKFQWHRRNEAFGDFAESSSSRSLRFRMVTSLAAHFYMSPQASFDISAEATYFPGDPDIRTNYSILPKVGLTIRF